MDNSLQEARLPEGVKIIDGREHMVDAKGRYVPIDLIKPADKLQDETVRKIMFYARDLSAQISRFKTHTFHDLSAYEALLEQE